LIRISEADFFFNQGPTVGSSVLERINRNSPFRSDKAKVEAALKVTHVPGTVGGVLHDKIDLAKP
jgi:hypothetical protein